MMVVGGADLGETFMRLDLIDEYRIYVHFHHHRTGQAPVPSIG